MFVLDIGDVVPPGVEYLIYADDLKLYCPVTDDASHYLLQSAVLGIEDWCNTNDMILSAGKGLVLKSRPDDYEYFISGTALPVSQFVRDLGEELSARLDYGAHILKIVNSTRNLVNSIFRVFVSRNPELYNELYRSLIASRFQYCSPVWRPHLKKHLNLLDSVRRRFHRRLELRCGYSVPSPISLSDLFDEQDLISYFLLKRSGCIDHFLSISA